MLIRVGIVYLFLLCRVNKAVVVFNKVVALVIKRDYNKKLYTSN